MYVKYMHTSANSFNHMAETFCLISIPVNHNRVITGIHRKRMDIEVMPLSCTFVSPFDTDPLVLHLILCKLGAATMLIKGLTLF